MRSDNVFIGRQTVLETIDQLVYDKDGRSHVFRIVGQGGVGKTWLLRKLYERYSTDSGLKVVRIDYSESRAQSLPTLTRYFLGQFDDVLPGEGMRDFLARLDDVERLKQAGYSYERLRQEEVEAYRFGMELLVRHVVDQKRIVILSDTIEAVREMDDKINVTAALIPNAVVILAGRDYPYVFERYATYPEIYKGWIVHDIFTLCAFDEEDTLKFFAALLPDLPIETQEKIHILTDGSPVLISIAQEWVSRKLALPKELDLPLQSLRSMDTAELAKLRQQFKFDLIAKVRQLGDTIDWAVLYTAYLNRRYNLDILKVALEIADDAKARSIDHGLRELSFVRKSMMGGPLDEGGLLHDEAQKLVIEHVWKLADPDGRLRRRLAARVLKEYYEPEIQRLRSVAKQKDARAIEAKLSSPDKALIPARVEEDWKRGELQIECMDYYARISRNHLWTYLDSLLDEADNYGSSVFESEVVENALYNLIEAEFDSPDFQIRTARLQLQRNDKAKAIITSQRALESGKVSAPLAARANIIIAQCTSNASDKLHYLNRALEQAALPEVLTLKAQTHNELGLAYRKQGKWHQSIDEYKNVLKLLNREESPDEYANTLNNLAFVLMLDGDPAKADNRAEEALVIRKELGNRRGLALSYSVKGRITEALGDTAQAERYHKTALALAESIGDVVYAALFQANIAAAERRAQNFGTARDLLKDGEYVDDPEVRARALQELARVDLEEAKAYQDLASGGEAFVRQQYEEARAHSNAALEIARTIDNMHLVAGSLLDLCLVAYYAERREDETTMHELERIATTYDFKLELGRLNELQGHLLLLQGDLEKSFGKFAIACHTLSRYSPAAFWQTFRRVRSTFFQLPPASRREACRVIGQFFIQIKPNNLMNSLRELCNDSVLEM